MSYASYADSVPSMVQLLISMVFTAGLSILLVGLFHKQLIALAQEPHHDKESGEPYVPPAYHLSGRIIQVTSLAFVFLFSFTVGQFVINSRGADSATQLEAQYWSRLQITAEAVPAAQGGDLIRDAAANYRAVVLDQEWPLMARGDQRGAYQLQGEAATTVTEAISRAKEMGADQTEGWDAMTSAVDDMLTNGSARISYVPNQNAVSLSLAVIVLGAVSLAMASIYQPTRRRINMVLIGIMGAVYGFMFYLVVELSNPYQGGGAITSLLALMK